jgi:hypothetical protein
LSVDADKLLDVTEAHNVAAVPFIELAKAASSYIQSTVVMR